MVAKLKSDVSDMRTGLFQASKASVAVVFCKAEAFPWPNSLSLSQSAAQQLSMGTEASVHDALLYEMLELRKFLPSRCFAVWNGFGLRKFLVTSALLS